MGRAPSIDADLGARLLEAYQRLGSARAAAAEIGVSKSAASRYLENTPKAAAPVVAQQRQVVEAAGVSLFDSTAALEENYRKVLDLIDKLDAGIVEIRHSSTGERYETRVSPAILVAALREAREYITAATRLLELMISVHEVRRFQQAILDVMASECDETTRQRIFDRLRQQLPLGLLPGRGR